MKKIIIYFIFFLPLFAGTVGKIKGRVLDSVSKDPIIGCNVYLPSTSYGSSTDLDGFFLILNVLCLAISHFFLVCLHLEERFRQELRMCG